MKLSRKWLVDAAERVASSAVEAFLGSLILGGVFSMSTLRAAEVSGAVAGLTAIKSLVASLVGNPDSASLGH